MRAILYVGHGTRSKKGADEAKQFLERVISAVKCEIQEISFLELTEPFIAEGFTRCVDRGATSICVVPVFLLSAGHIKKDIPEALEPLLLSYPDIPVEMTDPFGVREDLLDAMVELIKDAAPEVSRDDSVLIVGRGSSDPATLRDFARIVAGVKERMAFEQVESCYLAAASPTFQEGIEHICKRASGRVIVVPYLLFEGLLLAEVRREVRKRAGNGEDLILTSPLGKHEAVIHIIKNRAFPEEEQYAATHH
ncbi:sirohydrochlorin chelatase [Pradoshia sp.]